ncbi:hypothetical protein SAMD00019534_120190 [Acytostelium subglobosum LB1]|uniref:hypothetical protein n=1 Tax=Acytostelium subglobosum LB1 TaxID=1410327 RepID=UPI000644CAD1|nr:hypothetical protein SAMD00019534_120190 [Acytostelium subglobosum LB1]GAM28843.1 hypothetical protein SAMD00019534_120190 [Acytostelium subglobosum LB1]|eukprot:XP_012748215.1 hypothetical protein SAMD00019534_120190 [Acytostelium subglobosum LB1]
MGISGLLPLLSPVTRRVHIREYANKRVGIDGYCWLHKAVYPCSQELCQGIPTTKYISYCVSLLTMLCSNKVIPVLVFDGGPLPNKKVTEDDRRSKRDQMRAKANAYLMEGNHYEANRCFQKAVDVTPFMAFQLIKVLRQMNIEYLVAPYEADAQLAYLAVSGQIDAVLTEDSDLVAYGTPNMLFKMDRDGYCQEIKTEDIGTCVGKDYDLTDFTLTMLRHMCILSGCDYLPSLTGMGIKTAYKYVKRHRDIEKIFRALKSEKGMQEEYRISFYKADYTFRHQLVYDPVNKEIVHFSPIDKEKLASMFDTTDFLGEYIESEIAEKIAIAVVDPQTKQPFDNSVSFTFTFKPQPKKGGSYSSVSEANQITQYFNVQKKDKQQQQQTPVKSKNKPDPFELESDIEEEALNSLDKNDGDTDSRMYHHPIQPPSSPAQSNPVLSTTNLTTMVITTFTATTAPTKTMTSKFLSNVQLEDSFDFDFDELEEMDDGGNGTTSSPIMSSAVATTSTSSTTTTSMQSSSFLSTTSTTSTTTTNANKSFKKNTLLTEDRLTLNMFEQFMYGKKKESTVLKSTAVAAATTVSNRSFNVNINGNTSNNNNNIFNNDSGGINNNNTNNTQDYEEPNDDTGSGSFQDNKRKSLLFSSTSSTSLTSSPQIQSFTFKRKETFSTTDSPNGTKKTKFTPLSTPSSPDGSRTDTQEDDSFIFAKPKKSSSLPSFNSDSIFESDNEEVDNSNINNNDDDNQSSFFQSSKVVRLGNDLISTINDNNNIINNISSISTATVATAATMTTPTPPRANNQLTTPTLLSDSKMSFMTPSKTPSKTSLQEVPSTSERKYVSTTDEIMAKYFTSPSRSAAAAAAGSTIGRDTPDTGLSSWRARLSHKYRQSLDK